MADSTDRTARWLIGLGILAVCIGLVGVAVVWAFSYGPLG